MIRVPAYNKYGKQIGWYYEDKTGRRFVPFDQLDELKTLEANADFDGAIYRIKPENKTGNELKKEMNILMRTLEEAGSYQNLSTKKNYELIAIARKAFNRFQNYAEKIYSPQELSAARDRFAGVWSVINQYTVLQKEPKNLDLAAYRDTLASQKLDQMKYYLQKGFFNFNQRVTLFDLYNKSKLEPALSKYVLGQQGSLTFHQQVDELMAMLDKDFPAGYLTLPVIQVNDKGAKLKQQRRISLDYYLETWLSDIQATYHNAMNQAAYMQAGIDLVMVKTGGENNCEKCGEYVGKIFSLSGKNPDFPLCPHYPLHPNCDCYTVPVGTSEFWKSKPSSEKIRKKAEEAYKRKVNLPQGVTVAKPPLDDTFGNPDFKG